VTGQLTPYIIMALVVAVFPLMAGYIVLLERKIMADMQVRLGPMRVGPHGLLQTARRRGEVDVERRHHSDQSRQVGSFLVAPVIPVFTALTAFFSASVLEDLFRGPI